MYVIFISNSSEKIIRKQNHQQLFLASINAAWLLIDMNGKYWALI